MDACEKSAAGARAPTLVLACTKTRVPARRLHPGLVQGSTASHSTMASARAADGQVARRPGGSATCR
eukprot:360618-Chlamydomonas_euryale.AAC.5